MLQFRRGYLKKHVEIIMSLSNFFNDIQFPYSLVSFFFSANTHKIDYITEIITRVPKLLHK